MTDSVGADPWQTRLDRMRRVLPLPLLVVTTAVALAERNSSPHPAPILPLSIAAALLWATVTARPRLVRSPTGLAPVLVLHTALAGVLVWANPVYGIFGYTGFLFSYGLGPRGRIVGFTATALVVSAALAGYPSRDAGQTTGFVLVAVVLVALVLNSAMITNHAVEQNRERGRMVAELAEGNRRLAESMAENAALQERVLDQARAAGVLEERRRLAGEIHDTLAQGLTGIITQLEAARQTRQCPDESDRHIALAGALAREGLTEARRSVRALRPEQLEDATLPDALRTLARSWSQQTRIPGRLDTAGEPVPAASDIEAALFRVAQEALANVAKHARARAVHLTLTYLDDIVLLDVADDGVGFEPGAPADGFGLLGMRQRVDRLDGTLTVESTPGAGTTVNAALPLLTPSGGRR